MTDLLKVTEGVRPGELYYIAAKSGVGKSYVHCPHCSNPASEPHPCPYRHDIHGDKETLCTCCPDCEYECFSDI